MGKPQPAKHLTGKCFKLLSLEVLTVSVGDHSLVQQWCPMAWQETSCVLLSFLSVVYQHFKSDPLFMLLTFDYPI